MQVDRDKLHELKHKRAKLVEEMRILVKQDEERPDGEAMSDESSAAFDDLKDAIADIEGRITRLETLMMASAPDDEGKAEGDDDDKDKPKDKPDDDDDKRFGPYDGKGLASMHGMITPGGVRVYARPKGHGSIGPGFQIARFMIGVLHAKWNGREKACEFIQNRFGDDMVTRALNTTVVSEGGALIPQDFMSELIELLRANVVVRAAGPTTVQMPMGNLTIPRLAGGSTAAYQGELDDISISEEQFDDLDLFAKKLTAMVPVSNDLIRRAPIGIEAIVRDDLIQGIARREDLAFLRGDGTNKTPIGWRSLVLPANVLVIPVKGANPGDDLNAVVAALAAMKLVLVNGMSRMIKPTWFFAPTLIEYIKTRRDSVGSFYYREEINNGRLEGFPFYTSQQIPTNLGAGNGSEFYLVDMADTIIGDTMNVMVDASDVAAYYGTDGAIVSTFQRDQSLFRVISEHDFNMRHLQSLAIGTTTDWMFTGMPGSPGAPYSTQPLNPHWSHAPSNWPAVATGADAPPTLYDPGAAMTSAFDGPLSTLPAYLHPGTTAEEAAAPPPPPENGGRRGGGSIASR